MTRLRRIAVEEAFSVPEVAEALREVVRGPSASLDRLLCAGIYDADNDTTGYARMSFLDGLLDIEGERLRQMDAFGVDVHLLSLTAPGVQMFDADTATDLAALANDYLADVCRRHPTRFAGLASFAPHSPKRAAKEMDRAINDLKLNGFMINSHTYDEYLDDPKFWPILEAAEALDRCLYIHPRAASNGLKGPLQDYGMDSAMWGYGVEVGTHVVRMMAGGVFDRFPNLKICIGHMGEAIPFWIWRIAFMNKRAQAIGLARKTELTMDEYFRRNFLITTSGVEDHEALRYSINKLGADNVMWAIDYPYQPTEPAVEFLNTAPLTEEEKSKFAHRNAERVFHIAPASSAS